jgi:hypothetical protein
MPKKTDTSDLKNGPESYVRNDFGLLDNVDYIFNEDGSIDWRSMVKEEHLFPNKLWFERFNKPIPKTVDGLKDHQLLIKLSGIKELARLRGFSSVSYSTYTCEEHHVAISCTINFIPNYETNYEPISFEDVANATIHNTSSFAKKFLETIACNRAFVRCVRNFLNIHIVGMDEMDTSTPSESSSNNANSNSFNGSFSIHATLEKFSRESLGCNNFECFKDYLLNLKSSGSYINKNVDDWHNYEDIPSKEARILLGIIKQK